MKKPKKNKSSLETFLNTVYLTGKLYESVLDYELDPDEYYIPKEVYQDLIELVGDIKEVSWRCEEMMEKLEAFAKSNP